MRPRSPQRNRGKGEKTSLSAARLDALAEEALVDANGDSEQRTAFFTILDLPLASPPLQGADWIAAYRRWASAAS